MTRFGTKPVSTILIYTDGEVIGDGMLRLSFAQALKHALPDLKITWLSSGCSVYADALQAVARPFIDELIILPDRRIPLTEYVLGPRPLRGRRFDAVLDTQRNIKRAWWLRRICHRIFVSAAGRQILSTRRLPTPFDPHFLTRLLQLGRLATDCVLATAAVPLPPGPWLEQAAQLLPSGPRYIGFVVGAGHPDKCWPLTNFIALAKQMSHDGFTPVMFLGPQETTLLAALEAALPQALFPLNAAADPTPYLTIALGQRLTAAVANDSGGGHLLAAGGAPLVSLFRAASVRTKFLPQGERIIALAPEDFDVATMQGIPLGAVAAAMETVQSSRI